MFEKISDPGQVRIVEGHIPIAHRYTPGVAGERFFTALRDRGEFLASRCESCGIVYCPPRIFCERCFSELSADETVGPTGTLESFTVVHVDVERRPLDEPQVVGLVRLDGADTVLMHFLVDADELQVGQRVEAVLVPDAERVGSMLDIRGFRPAG
jgi:uncharacterized protein